MEEKRKRSLHHGNTEITEKKIGDLGQANKQGDVS
jgi:hypothetical protein